MKILLVISSIELGGAEQYLLELARELRGLGHQVAVVTPESLVQRMQEKIKPSDIRLIAAGVDWAWGPEDDAGGCEYDAKVARQRKALAKILADNAFDVAVINANWPTHYPGAMQALREANVKFGAHFHLCPHTIPLNCTARLIHAEVLPCASFLTVVSNSTRFFAEQTFGRLLNFGVIANGGRFFVDKKNHESLAETPREHLLISVGRLDHQKGYLDLIPAFNMPSALSRYKIQLLGDGPLGLIIQSLIAPDRSSVKLVGQVQNVDDYFRRADGFVLPSHFEGMSLAIIEAMSFGCIPIVSDASSARELVTEGENGFLFDVGNWRSFLLAIHRFDRSDKVELRRKCLRRSLSLTRSRMLGSMVEKIVAVN